MLFSIIWAFKHSWYSKWGTTYITINNLHLKKKFHFVSGSPNATTIEEQKKFVQYVVKEAIVTMIGAQSDEWKGNLLIPPPPCWR